MSIKNIKTVADLGLDGVKDFGGQGAIKYVHELSLTEITRTPEYMKAVEYVKALARIKKLLTTTIKEIPLTNRGTMLKALQFEMKKHDFDYPVMNLKLAGSTSKDESSLAPTVLEYLNTRVQLSTIMSSFSDVNRKKAIKELIYV